MPNTTGQQGYIHSLKDGIDIKRLMIVYPIYKVLVNLYKPVSFSNSLMQDKTSDIEYSDTPYKEDLAVIITNLEHYGESDVIYESFEEDKTLLKVLTKTGEEVDLPDGTKVIVKDVNKNNYKTYIVDATTAIRSVMGTIIAQQCELTPIYLKNQSDNLLLTAKRLQDTMDAGTILEDDGTANGLDSKDVIEELKEFTEEGLLKLNVKGTTYYE